MIVQYNTRTHGVGKPNSGDIDHLATLIYGWGAERNITISGGASSTSQVLKAMQEFIEFSIACECESKWLLDTRQDVIDGLGDVLTCLIQASRIYAQEVSADEAGNYPAYVPDYLSLMSTQIAVTDELSKDDSDLSKLRDETSDAFGKLLISTVVKDGAEQHMHYVMRSVIKMGVIQYAQVTELGADLVSSVDVRAVIYEALSKAYSEIKDRKGTMKNGMFFKEDTVKEDTVPEAPAKLSDKVITGEDDD